MRKPFALLVVLAALCLASFATVSRAATVDALLSSMSLEEKVGQMMLVAFKGPELSPELSEMIEKRHVGGVILYSSWGNVQGIGQVAALTAAIQERAARTPRSIGMFIGVDQEGGPVNRLREGVTVFPSQMAIAATGNREHARAMAAVTAEELSVLGFTMNFVPSADINTNPQNPIIGIRAFSSDPNTVSRLTSVVVAEYVRSKVLCTPKHFPGHGDTDTDSHVGLPVNNHDARTLDRIDFAPFRAAIKAGAPAVMTAHVAVPALEQAGNLPATLSRKILEEVLRRQLRFDGLIVTDSLGMGALSRGVGTVKAAVEAAKAGADVLLFGADLGHEPAEQIQAWEALLAAAKSGELPLARIDAAVRRILEAKRAYSILDAKAIPDKAALIPYRVGNRENYQAAQAAARDSITLRHDRQRLLPLTQAQRVLVVWPERTTADPVEELALPAGAVLLRTKREPDAQDVRAAAEAFALADKAVVLTYDAVRNAAQQSLMRTLLAMKPHAVVHVALGGPYDLSLFPDATTSIATYGDVPVSVKALSDALLGRAPFTGRLPVRLP